MIQTVHHAAPACVAPGNALYAGYTEERASALSFFSHSPRDLAAAIPSRSALAFPRRELAAALERYHLALGAPQACMANLARLADPRSLCVVTGQQAGFLAGPLYTSYKIVTAIRVAQELAASTGRPVLPIFWLASEDHDFQEINHTYSLGDGAEVRRISFPWAGSGRPIRDLPVTDAVRGALRRYTEEAGSAMGGRELISALAPSPADAYCSWIARLLLRVFGKHGLLIVEPHTLSPLAGLFFAAAFSRTQELREGLRGAARALAAEGYAAPLDPEQAALPFRMTSSGLRVRSERDPSFAREAASSPEAFSADAALRPILQDTLLPTAVSILGPGEISYQAMLRPLYQVFQVPQPVLLPRLSMTLMTQTEAELTERCGLGFEEIISPDFQPRQAIKGAVPSEQRELFDSARDEFRGILERLEPRLVAIDPNLRVTAARTREAASRALERLEERAHDARLAREGIGVRSLRRLRASLFPRGSLQERIYPLPFLLQRHPDGIVEALFSVGSPGDFRHHVAVAAPR